MAVYNRFGPSDVVHYNLQTSPRVVAASGSSGWRANTGPSASISLYGGIRSKLPTLAGDDDVLNIQPVYDLDTFTIDGRITLSASYPFTGTLTYAQVIDRHIDLNDELTPEFWGKERFSPILNLYEFYSRTNAEYTTGSYDYYMLYSEASSTPATGNKVTYSGSYSTMSSSYTVEAMVKPLSVIGSEEDHTIVSRTGQWSFFITGSDGKLAFSASDGSGVVRTSSFAVTRDRWQHVAYRMGNDTGSFHVDMVDAGQVIVTGSIDPGAAADAVNVFYNEERQEDVFHGFAFEVKLWDVERTFAELSSSFDRTLVQSGSADLLLYSRFNDGPRSTDHGSTRGSGAFDYSDEATSGLLQNFDARIAPVWHPNDNPDFIVPKRLIGNSIDEMRVVHVPSMFYGRQIATGSVELTCNAFLSSSLQRTLVDDGRGGLFLSGSATSGSLEDRESFQGVRWNKVGNVFYSEGLIVVRDPALLDFALTETPTELSDDILQVSFRGQQRVPTKVFMCRIDGAAANASNNQTFTTFDSGSDKHRVVRDDPTTYVTAVGLYNGERKLVAVAKLAQPIRNRERDKLNIRLKMDF